MEEKNENKKTRKQPVHHEVVKKKQRNVPPSLQPDGDDLEMIEPHPTFSLPMSQLTLLQSPELWMERNKFNRPRTVSMNTLDSSLDASLINNLLNLTTDKNTPKDSHQCITLTAPHLSEPQNKTMLTKEAKDMRLASKTNPSASFSLSQDTTREIINSTQPTRSPQEKLQSTFDCRGQDTFEPSFQCSYLEEIKESGGPVNYSVPTRSVRTDLPYASKSGLRRRDRSNSSPSISWGLIPQDPAADVSILAGAASLPIKQTNFEEFTPDFTGDEDDEDDETYWLRCSSPGLYQCRVSGLVFDMKAEGDVSYRIVPWSSRLLSQHAKKPAGPLFDIRCQQQTVAQLHLPHCEIHSTGGCTYLSVAHVGDEGIEFIRPEEITETHVIINITGFSAFGIVKGVDSPCNPIRALVLLFYKPPAAPNKPSFLSVLLLPANVGTQDVKRKRQDYFRAETFIDVPPQCRLQPEKFYTLSTDPAGDSVLVQPTEAEFDAESYDNPLTSIQVVLKSPTEEIRLSVKEKNSSCCVWESHVCLLPQRENTGLPAVEQLTENRTKIIDGISEPVLKSLLDKLLEIKVLSDAEKEEVEKEKTRGDKARLLVDMVRRKGNDASSEMIRLLTELDPFFSKHLGLM